MSIKNLRRVAEAADADGREWEWQGGYPQKVVRAGDVVVVADCFESPDAPSVFAEFIATFDPPTVLALLDLADRHTTPAPTDPLHTLIESLRDVCCCGEINMRHCPVHGAPDTPPPPRDPGKPTVL